MKKQTLKSILVEELGAKDDGGRMSLPTGTRITVFVATAGVPIPVTKVTAVTLREGYAILDSEEGRVFTHLEEFAAVRADEEATGGGRVGF